MTQAKKNNLEQNRVSEVGAGQRVEIRVGQRLQVSERGESC